MNLNYFHKGKDKSTLSKWWLISGTPGTLRFFCSDIKEPPSAFRVYVSEKTKGLKKSELKTISGES